MRLHCFGSSVRLMLLVPFPGVGEEEFSEGVDIKERFFGAKWQKRGLGHS